MRVLLTTTFLLLFPSGRLFAEECIASVYSTRDGSQSGSKTASGKPLKDIMP